LSDSFLLLAADPGNSGAVAVVTPDSVSVFDLPVTEKTFLLSQKRRLDIPAFSALIREKLLYLPEGTPVLYVSEQMQSFGGKNTPARTLLGLAEIASALEAVICCVCRSCQLPLLQRRYQPRVWTKWLFPEGPHQKEDSLEKARLLFPELRDSLLRKKDHNRAEALLLSYVVTAELRGLVVETQRKSRKKLEAAWLCQDAEEYPASLETVVGKIKTSAAAMREIEHRLTSGEGKQPQKKSLNRKEKSQ
jgi:hypothetical protein